jgi:hypothetical protein
MLKKTKSTHIEIGFSYIISMRQTYKYEANFVFEINLAHVISTYVFKLVKIVN